MSDFIIGAKPIARVEVCRSYAHKINCANWGGPAFESRDFFASRKAECAIEDEAEVSERLFQSCRAEVIQAATDYVMELKRRAEAKEAKDIRRIS